MPVPDDHARVLAYHERTKHRPGRYAASLGYLDWDSQPNPFRIHAGADLLPLARDPLTAGPDLPALYTGAVPPAPLSADLLAALLLHSLALSAWKQAGQSRWSLRVNPSSGNLHPTEAHLLAPPIHNLSQEPALYHYSPLLHALERRAVLPADVWTSLTAGLPPNTLLIGLTSIVWREAWKYGERSFRYCQHDLGHAVAALAYAAALLGWRAHELPAPGDAALAALLGLRPQVPDEPELPETLLLLVPSDMSPGPSALAAWTPPPAVLAWFTAAELAGEPNRLSEDHHPWPILADIAAATHQPDRAHRPVLSDTQAAAAQAPAPPTTPAVEPVPSDTPAAPAPPTTPAAEPVPSDTPATPTPPTPPVTEPVPSDTPAAPTPPTPPVTEPVPSDTPRDAATILRGRRSAVAMDGRTGITRAAFYDLLLRTAPTSRPLTALAGPPRVDLAIFVHRVADLDPGLYFLLRDPARQGRWRAACEPEFPWTLAPGCPAGLDLRLLHADDLRTPAAAIACGQAIAADGCFALAMLADFTALQASPWSYRRLFWESGAIGQVLYLEAEALGISATGIGCFFDDPMHELLGLDTTDFQSLYHFTIGGRVDDPRLRTLDPYHHLDRPT